MGSSENAGISVITVPFPAQGHLNQMLQLSSLISSYGIPVHYAGSAVFNRQAKLRANRIDIDKINFLDLPVPPFASLPPVVDARKKFPAHLQPAWDAAMSMAAPLGEFMRSEALKHRRVVVIHDPLIGSVVKDVATTPNAESYAFNCLSAYCQVKFGCEQAGRSCPIQRLRELQPISEIISEEIQCFLALQNEALGLRSGDIFNTCRLIEGPFLEILEKDELAGHPNTWAIGPLIPATANPSSTRHTTLGWLDKQPPRSVIFISFGTMTTLSYDEIQVVAAGVEGSGQRFIWILREADKANVFDGEATRLALPPAFEERLRDRGLVVRDWAPQPEILAHPSTAAFMSHCGWNSCNESIKMGVPIAAWPMHSDQPTNAVLVTEVLRVGLPLRKWAEEAEVVAAETVEDVVRRLVASEEGAEIRKRAEELAAIVRGATEEGGASRLEMDSFIAVATVAVLCGNAIAQSSSAILMSGQQVVLAVALLHTSGFFFGYVLSRVLGIDVSSSRTISIEVGMQNSVLGVVLATQHFGDPLTAVPCAVSSVCHSIFGSVLAGIWRRDIPKKSEDVPLEATRAEKEEI